MHRTTRILSTLLAVAACAAAGTASARNDSLVLPIEAALRAGDARYQPAADIALRFGRASAQGIEPIGTGAVHAVVDPFGAMNQYGQRSRLADAEVCANAFRKAVAELQARARAAGAGAVVGIVSAYRAGELDSPTTYECRIGHTRGFVDLKGTFAPGPQAAAPARPAPQ